MNYPTPYDDPFARRRTRWWSFGRGAVPGQTGIKGIVTEIGQKQQSTKWNPNPNAPKELDWWDPEKTRPKEYVPITLQTTLNEPNQDFPEDDGLRTLAIDIQYKPGGKMNAIQEAVKAAGGKTLQVGGELALWFTGLDPESDNPDNPRKLYAARYALPVSSGEAAFGYQEPQQAPPQQYAPGGGQFQAPGANTYPASPPPAMNQPQYGQQPSNPYGQPQQSAQQYAQAATQPPAQQPPAQQPPNVTPDAIKARLAQGQDVGQIVTETGATADMVNAVRNFAGLQAPQQADPPF